MQLTSNIINTAGLNMSQMSFVNTRPCTSNIAQASDVAAKIEFVTMAEMALKSGKIMIYVATTG